MVLLACILKIVGCTYLWAILYTICKIDLLLISFPAMGYKVSLLFDYKDGFGIK